jgi:small-conductance mechanosensitive channel
MAETFKFDVAYDTTFNQLEQLRKKMLAYLMTEKRDFLPCFDVWVVGKHSTARRW